MRVALATAVLLLGLAPAAAASVTVSVDPSLGLRIVVSGTDSDVHVGPAAGAPNRLRVTETGNRQITAGSGCQQGEGILAGQPFVTCSRPTLAFVSFTGGGLRDKLTLTAGVGDCLCEGRGGNDDLRGSDGADLILGGDGNDLVRGGPGGDVLRGQNGDDRLDGEDGDDVLEGGADEDTLDGGNGADAVRGQDGEDVFDMGSLPDGADGFDGGSGVDRANYGGRRAAVVVSLDGSANDGGGSLGQLFGERDNVTGSVEQVSGGAGADRLTGSRFRNTLFGGGGDDTLVGGSPGPSDASPGVDDTLDGGPGSDILDGGGGTDRLLARDAVDDQVDRALSCGPQGQFGDVLEADVRDDDTRPLPSDCETVSQGMVGELPNVHIRAAKRTSGGLAVAIRCPRKARIGCAGRMSVRGARARYSVRRGSPATVTLATSARVGARVRVRSVERGRLGPRTTLQTLVVKR
jgi:Ca2+-binding RTX toxin-like protein